MGQYDVEKDWIQLMAQGPACKEVVTNRLVKMMRQALENKTQKGGSAMTKKPRNPEPLVLEVLAGDKKLVQEIRGDSKTIVDCVNGQAQLRTDCCNRPESLARMEGPRC